MQLASALEIREVELLKNLFYKRQNRSAMQNEMKNLSNSSPAGITSLSKKTNLIKVYANQEPQKGIMYLDENVILFLVSGKMTISYGGLEAQVMENQLVFLKKEILIAYETQPNEQTGITEYIAFSLTADLVSEFTKLAELSLPILRETLGFVVTATDNIFSHFISSLRSCLLYAENNQCRLQKIKLMELLFYLASYQKPIINQLLQIRHSSQTNISDLVEENVLNSMSVNQLAVLAGRSLSSFRRDFLSIYNMPPSQWIRKRRLEKAKELLRSTTMSITDVCYTTGFENIAHFSRSFKSQFRCSPSNFRQTELTT